MPSSDTESFNNEKFGLERPRVLNCKWPIRWVEAVLRPKDINKSLNVEDSIRRAFLDTGQHPWLEMQSAAVVGETPEQAQACTKR